MGVRVSVSCERTTGPGKVCGKTESFKTVEEAKASGWYIPSDRIAVCPKDTTWLERNRG